MAGLARIGPLGAAVVLALAVALVAAAAPGDLDPNFGVSGRAVVSPAVESVATAIALQPDGKIVLAGWADDVGPPPPPPPAPDALVSDADFLTTRLTASGALDATFGSGGSVRTPINLAGGNVDAAWAAAVASTGQIYVGGLAYKSGGSDLAIARYTPSGVLDPGFAGTGIRTLDLHEIDGVNGLAAQPDGMAVAAVRGGSGFTVVRFGPDGELDTGFGADGIVATNVGAAGVQDEATAVLVLADGKIVVAGAADWSFPYTQTEFALVRYLPDGTLDPTFGTGGIVVTPGPNEEFPYDLAQAPNGKLVAAGYADRQFRLARYLATGALDTAFGDGGTVTTSFGGLFSSGRSVVVQQDGKIVVGGAMRAEGVGQFDQIALARYKVDGSLDSSFGTGGKRTYDVLAGHDMVTGLVIQPGATAAVTDRLVVASRSSDGDGASDHVVALGVDLGPMEPQPPVQCRVPRVIRLRLATARSRIRRANCRVGRIRRVRARRLRGKVVAQSPRAGRRLLPGSRVNLVVGRR